VRKHMSAVERALQRNVEDNLVGITNKNGRYKNLPFSLFFKAYLEFECLIFKNCVLGRFHELGCINCMIYLKISAGYETISSLFL